MSLMGNQVSRIYSKICKVLLKPCYLLKDLGDLLETFLKFSRL
jgi:hypothetical protein